ncbi:MAG TPA: hypothetical protein VK447_07615, partial [Myxococcaceae bacterium]|nr:hypothetical protein [Myxococcaceae bacterium]
LGAPLEDEHFEGDQVVQRFEHGVMTWRPETGVSMQVSGGAQGPGGPQGPGGVQSGQGINPTPEFAGLYKPFELTPGVTLPSHLGVHWGPATGYSNTERINTAADMLAQRGVGFSTVIVDPANVAQQQPTIKALLDRGIQPVVRLLPASSYGERTMDTLNEGEMQQLADAAAQLKDMGVKVIQLDNEPNLGNKDLKDKLNNPARQGEYKEAMGRYVNNLAHTMDLINQRAPGMSIGFGVLASGPGHDGWAKMWDDMMWGMKGQNDARGGQLLQNAWIGVHPYTIGQFNPDGRHSDGVNSAEWMKNNARAILGTDINVLATEGGNPQDRVDQAQISSDLNVEQLKQTAKNPDMTQCFWIVSDDYLLGKNANDGKGPWEHNAFIHVDDRGNPVPTLFFRNMLHVARGEALERA